MTGVTWGSASRVAVIPGWLVLAKVSHPAIRVYALLSLHVGEDAPTHDQMADTLGVGRGVIVAALADLVGVGAVERDGRSYQLIVEQRTIDEPVAPPEAQLPDVRHDDIEQPPPVPYIAGRNLPLDAICRECDIGDGSPRVAQATAALFGRGKGRTSKGITHLFWTECRDYAASSGKLDELVALHADGERYAALLAQAITARTARIRQTQAWRDNITPKLIRDLWVDVDNLPDPRPSRRGLTPDEIRQIR